MTQKKWKPASRCSSEHRSSTRRSTAEPQHCWLLSPLQHNCCQPSDCKHIGCRVDNVNTMVNGAVVVSLVASMTRGLSIMVHLVSPLQHNLDLEQKNIATCNLQLVIGQPLGTEHHRKQILIRVALSSVLVHFVVECFRLLALQENDQNPVFYIVSYQCQRVGNARPFLSWLLLLLLISPT